MPNYPITPKKVDPEIERQNKYYVFGNRVKKLNESLQDFNSLLAEAEALFGLEFRKKCQVLVSKINQYHRAVDEHLQRDIFDDEYYLKNIQPIVFRKAEEFGGEVS